MRKIVINLIRGHVVSCLVKPFPVIKGEPMPETFPHLGFDVEGPEREVMIL
jgi:hypothetical protein